jgi:serine/threonine protein kinase
MTKSGYETPDGDDDRTVIRPIQPQASAPSGAAAALEIGTTINNNYRILKRLKPGGMGEVFQGEHIHTGKPVAIKAVLQDLSGDGEFELMFRREALTLCDLRHETIVQFENYVPDPDLQRYFLIMEFIEGVTLKDHIETSGALRPEEVGRLLVKLTSGLAAAHKADVIHRDLSPDNIMLAGGDVENARLIDFGIAKSNNLAEGTVAGRFAGKFSYVAPEQLGPLAVTPSADIYSLGLLIAAAAQGRPLDMGGTIMEAVRSRETIPDLSGVPEQLQPILRYMLEPDPMQRPTSMEHVQAIVEDPTLIPPQYFGAQGVVAPLVSAKGATKTTQTQPMTSPPGLQVPGLTQPVTSPPMLSQSHTPLSSKPPRSGGFLRGLFTLIVLGGVGAGGYFAYDNGILDPILEFGTDAAVSDQPARGIPAPLTQTREGYLASLDTGDCTLMARVSTGVNSGVIEAYSTSGTSFPGVSASYEERFGARPEILARRITQSQCAVLDFVKALQGRGRDEVGIALSTHTIGAGAPLQVDVVSSARAQWAALINTAGQIVALTNLEAVNDGRLSAALVPSAAERQLPAVQMVLVVDADLPLNAPVGLANGTLAQDFLPRLMAEVVARDGAVSAAVAYLEVVAD